MLSAASGSDGRTDVRRTHAKFSFPKSVYDLPGAGGCVAFRYFVQFGQLGL